MLNIIYFFLNRVNRAENYALLERMRSLSNRHQVYQGPPPVNLLEKQFQVSTLMILILLFFFYPEASTLAGLVRHKRKFLYCLLINNLIVN